MNRLALGFESFHCGGCASLAIRKRPSAISRSTLAMLAKSIFSQWSLTL